MRSPTFVAVFGSVLGVLGLGLGVGARPAAAAPGPYFDKDRNLEQQREAARDAKNAVEGGAGLEEVLGYLSQPSAQVRDEVFEALVERADPELLRALGRFLGSRDAFVSAAVAELYGATEFAEGREALEKVGLGSRDELTALESVWALEALGDPAAGAALEKAYQRRREFRVQGDALVALATVDPERAGKLVPEALEHKLPPVRIAALEALWRLDPSAAASAAVDIVAAQPLGRREKAWEARLLFAALDVLSAWRQRTPELGARAVEALMARLEREEGLPAHRVGQVLEDLTGAEGLAADLAGWRGWWDARREGFAPREPSADEAPDEDAGPLPLGGAAARRPETGGGGGTRVRFHGIPIHSQRMIFAQDVSGGMNNPLNKEEAGSPSKMEFSKGELIRVLGELDDDTGVNVVFFATEYYTPAESLLPLGRARAQLIDFVARQETPSISAAQDRHKSRSNLYDPLAFMLQDPEIDTVFFLSEGSPNEGRWVDWDRFLRHLKLLNRYTRVTVHCLQVSTSKVAERFLKRLAAATGGRYYDMEFLERARDR